MAQRVAVGDNDRSPSQAGWREVFPNALNPTSEGRPRNESSAQCCPLGDAKGRVCDAAGRRRLRMKHHRDPRRRRNLGLLGGLSAGLLVISMLTPAQAVLNTSLFELDKDAGADVTSTRLGTLGTQIANATGTSINVCRTATSEPSTAGADSFTILIDAERMNVTDAANGSFGGNCSGGTKRTYTVVRAFNGTSAISHSGGENVTLLDFTAKDGADWSEIYLLAGDDPSTDCDPLDDPLNDINVVACTFVHDIRGESIFTQSKDYDEISDDEGATVFWQWRDQSVPDADELDDGFAVKYVDANGDQNLYFGADRFATNGTKDAGFWFFHDEVGTDPEVPSGDSTFHGVHTEPSPGPDPGDQFCDPADGGDPEGGPSSDPTDCELYDANDTGGDILLLTTFTGGGAVTTIRLFEWIGPAGNTDALFQRATASDCVPGPVGSVCATVNNTTVESGKFGDGLWPYDGKSEPQDNAINAGGLLEGGVNLSDLGLEGCFSSFMATTRSSDSLTADPKDFILGSFESCASTTVTTPKDGEGNDIPPLDDNDTPDDPSDDTGGLLLPTADQVDADPSITLQVKDEAEVTVTGTDTFGGDVTFFLCGPADLDAPDVVGEDPDDPATCDVGGTQIGDPKDVVAPPNPDTVLSDPAEITSAGRYCWRAVYSGDEAADVPGSRDATEGECFDVRPVQPTLDTMAVDENGNPITTAVPFGSTIYDEATLNGTAYQPGNPVLGDPPVAFGDAAAGTITFKLYGPLHDDPNTEDVIEGCDELAAGFPTAGITVDVSGDGTYGGANDTPPPPSVEFQPQSPGVFHWKAEYSGDLPNTLGDSHNDDCSDSDESVTIQQLQPTMDTEQNFIPNDSATISVGAGAGDLDGNVDFYLWVEDETCGDGDLTTRTQQFLNVPVSAVDTGPGPLTATASTQNLTAYDLDDDLVVNGGDADGLVEFYWLVVFESNNGAHLGITGTCGNENSSIAIDNGVTEPQSV
jgi:hypothetical protein